MNRRAQQAPLLTRLEVQSLATIETLDLELSGGLSVFTGETGAGKSIIVDALGLLLGERAKPDLIRRGEEQLLVTGFWSAVKGTAKGDVRGDGGAVPEETVSSRRVSRVFRVARCVVAAA